MAPTVYFDYAPYREAPTREKLYHLVNVMEQNDFKISYIRARLQGAELPQNDVTHEQLDRALRTTEAVGKILENKIKYGLLTKEVLLYKELLDHKEWQIAQLIELELELMRLSSGIFSGPVMASSAVASTLDDWDRVLPEPSPLDTGSNNQISPAPLSWTSFPTSQQGTFLHDTADVGPRYTPKYTSEMYNPEHAPYPFQGFSPVYVAPEESGDTFDDLFNDIPDAVPFDMSTLDQNFGFDLGDSAENEIPMLDLTSDQEPVPEVDTKEDISQPSTPDSTEPAVTVVLVQVCRNGKAKKHTTKRKAIKSGSGWTLHL